MVCSFLKNTALIVSSYDMYWSVRNCPKTKTDWNYNIKGRGIGSSDGCRTERVEHATKCADREVTDCKTIQMVYKGFPSLGIEGGPGKAHEL